MVTVHRSGSIVSIPRRLSHHVPTVLIIESEAFENRIVVAEMEIVGKQTFPFQKKSKTLTPVEQKVLELLKGRDVFPDEMINILQQVLTDENLKQMKEMIERGMMLGEIIKYFLEKGEIRKIQ